MQKLFRGWLGFLLALALVLTSSPIFNDKAEASESTLLDVSRSTFSLTEKRTVDIQADLGEDVDLDDLEFEFGGKSLSEWKKWSGGDNYDGEPFINVIEGPSLVDDTSEVQATIEFGLPYDTTDLSNRTIRTQYQQFIDDYELALINQENGKEATATVKLNVYDEFLFYDQRKPAIDQIIEQSNETNDRYVKYKSLGKTAEGRDLNFVILAKDKKAVDKYLNETLPTALEEPASLIEKIENGTMGDYQVPIWFNNMHADEVEGPDAQIELLEKFAIKNEVTFNMDEEGQERTVTLDVDEVLDDVIFLYAFENNPDGRVINTRQNANGFDPNRDNHYQTQVEQQQITQEIAKWTPLSFIDMHGYVEGFLIEPTTPPHNPNYEYDLLYNKMVEQAHSLGQAGIGNSTIDSYFIPALDQDDGWDDATPAYAATFAMLHGSLGHTVEVPTLGQDGYDAMVGSALGATSYVVEKKDELFKNQLKIFKRGVNGEDNRAVDEYFVNAAGESIGRQRGDNENFFPDYYAIPTEDRNQKNNLQAHKMVDYLLRNGVKVEKLTKNTNVNGTMYRKGTFVVPMNQAKRGLANAVLYEGENLSDWRAMYDPVVVNFPALRGFDVYEVRAAGAFTNTAEVENITLPTGEIVGNPPKQVLENSNNDTIKLVNELLEKGVTVEKAVETKARVNKGDFIVNTNDLRRYGDDYYFEAKPLGTSRHLKTEQLKQPKVAVDGSPQLKFSLRNLGFDLVDQAAADVIISDGRNFDPTTLSGKSFVGTGVNALSAVKESGLLPGFSYDNTRNGHEGLFKAKVNDHVLTSGYQEDELLYSTSGAWITSVPENAEVLATFSDEEDFYVAGWWPGYEDAQGQTLAFTQNLEDTAITLFSNDLAFRAHTQYSYRFLANSIFDSSTAE
ncbi:X-prolyl-dipeptidyl aminopeptidase [Lentibacillus lipolyticus]|nr:X-prolyl-dipeptidyl aminopeptidase [Lentibacillus lipolyticus]